MEISRKHHGSPVKLEFVSAFDEGSKIISQLAACQRLPVIEYSESKVRLDEVFKAFDRFLKSNLRVEYRLIIRYFKEQQAKEVEHFKITREATRSRKKFNYPETASIIDS